MEPSASDGSRASVSKSKEGSWWRWSDGTSGSTASSSHFGSLCDPSNHVNSNSQSKPAATAFPSDEPRWQKRTTRTHSDDSVSAVLSVAWSPPSLDPWSTSSSPHYSSATDSMSLQSSRVSMGLASKKAAASSPSTHGHQDRKLALEETSPRSSTFLFWTREGKRAPGLGTSGSMGKSKRLGTRKDRRSAKSASFVVSSTQATRARMPHWLPEVNGDTEMRAPSANSNVFALSTPQDMPSQSARLNELKCDQIAKTMMTTGPVRTLKEDCPKLRTSTTPPLSPSAASTASTTSSLNLPSFSSVDPLVNCARAVLQDCIRNRQMEQRNARKRSIENEDLRESKAIHWHCKAKLKLKERGNTSSGSSSSSDDELSQLSSMDQSFCTEKSDRGLHRKVAREEMYRQILVGDYDLCSSLEYQCMSPMIEEIGLPIEVRYQLPLALGTANETSKECTICQLRYGIGDHIVTLPCQHFFHACCVDKWLWNHTSCPLCRTEVILDQKPELQSTKHNFTKCSPVDQERIRRQLRSSSQHAGFRPVVPVDIDQLELKVSCMAIDEDLEDEPSYLICPTPHLATNAPDDLSGNR